jgi:hypothetical protein
VNHTLVPAMDNSEPIYFAYGEHGWEMWGNDGNVWSPAFPRYSQLVEWAIEKEFIEGDKNGRS